MDEQTLRALRASVEHWEENVEAETPNEASISMHHCALCLRFFEDGCSGCPVFNVTKVVRCFRTPYGKASLKLTRWHSHPYDAEYRDEWRKAAQAELDFLRGLLPEEKDR